MHYAFIVCLSPGKNPGIIFRDKQNHLKPLGKKLLREKYQWTLTS